MIFQDCVINYYYKSTSRVNMVTKLCKIVTCPDGLPPTKSHDRFIAWSYEITWQTQTVIFYTTVPMVTKLHSVVTYLERFQTKKSYNFLIMWYCKVAWHTITVTFLLPQCLCWIMWDQVLRDHVRNQNLYISNATVIVWILNLAWGSNP